MADILALQEMSTDDTPELIKMASDGSVACADSNISLLLCG